MTRNRPSDREQGRRGAMPRRMFDEILRERLEVLLVEDNPDHALLITRLLKRAFVDPAVVHVATLAEGIASLKTKQFRIVLCDLSLPDAAGIDAVAAIQDIAVDAAIVVVTAHAGEQLAHRALRAGAQDYLVKEELTDSAVRRSILHALDRQALWKRLGELAYRDQLTGLMNRDPFQRELERAINRAGRRNNGEKIGLMFIDLDDFKEINDTWGHQAGDDVLVHVARQLESSIRGSDIAARIAGDEFAVLLSEQVEDTSRAAEVAARVLDAINQPVELRDRAVQITASIGIVLAGGDESAEELLRKADAAMYQAKESGRDQYSFFDTALDREVRDRKTSERLLYIATDRHQFTTFFQPVINTDNGLVVGAEALIRWSHPTRGIVGPEEFLDILEEEKLIEEVGHRVLVDGCAAARRWKDRGVRLTVSVNVAARQFCAARFAESVDDTLRQAGLVPRDLCIEITESVLMERPTQAARSIHELAELGVPLALDDFGTGYSRLADLRRLPITTLKIDRQFVSGRSQVDEKMVSALVHLAHCFGCGAVAEGVETQTQLDVVRRLRCESWQGYLALTPCSEPDFSRWLDTASIVYRRPATTPAPVHS